MSKHTPGPWNVDQPSNGGGWWIVRDAIGNELGSGDGGFEQADACLIAAAPELLDALRESIEYIPGKYRPVLMKKARAAIAKAMGEA